MPEEIQAFAFFLADHAVVENGKLYVNGGFWNQVYSAEYPVARAFGLAAVLHIPWRKHHQGHAFTVTFEDADGRPLTARFEGQFRVGTSPNMRVGDFTVMPVAAFVTNFVLGQSETFAQFANSCFIRILDLLLGLGLDLGLGGVGSEYRFGLCNTIIIGSIVRADRQRQPSARTSRALRLPLL